MKQIIFVLPKSPTYFEPHYIHNKVDGQTWYIQDILNRLYQNGKEITTAEIDDVTLELVNEQEVSSSQKLRFN